MVNLTIRNKKIIWTFIKFIVVQIGPVVSEEEIFEKKKFTTMDGRHTPSDDRSTHGLWPGELKCRFIN